MKTDTIIEAARIVADAWCGTFYFEQKGEKTAHCMIGAIAIAHTRAEGVASPTGRDDYDPVCIRMVAEDPALEQAINDLYTSRLPRQPPGADEKLRKVNSEEACNFLPLCSINMHQVKDGQEAAATLLELAERHAAIKAGSC